MSDFSQAVAVILNHEGGYVNDPEDSGGPTNYGISLKWYGTIKPDATEDDIKSLSFSDAAKLYEEYFWNGYGQIKDQQVATKIFDMAVNMGAHEAHRLTQQALNDCGQQVQVDGVLGVMSYAAIAGCDPVKLLDSIITEQVAFYKHLVEIDPQKAKFLPEWLARAKWPY